MDGCRFVIGHKTVKGKTSDVLCSLVAQEGSAFCPRHTFLHNMNAQAERDREVERQAAKRRAL